MDKQVIDLPVADLMGEGYSQCDAVTDILKPFYMFASVWPVRGHAQRADESHSHPPFSETTDIPFLCMAVITTLAWFYV